MASSLANEFVELLDHSIKFNKDVVEVVDVEKFRKHVGKLAYMSALEKGAKRGMAQYIIRSAALALGVIPSSINDLYMARGRGEVPFTFTVPAMNLRVTAFDAACAVFRAAKKVDAAAMIFEIARSEMNYTDQRPNEYTASILAAAMTEGYTGPVFVQGDHFQVSAKRYASDPTTEIDALKALIREALAGGFFNIDVDTSTLVDLKYTTIPEQQKLNVELSGLLTSYIRSQEPAGVTISVGGEIGEVGGHNSTEEELRAYVGGFNAALASNMKGATGLSKISIQTGTSHGGVVLPDGTIAKVAVDFATMLNLSRVSRQVYGMGGAVQHGASTLPEDAFHHFVESEAVEVHLATNFMNIFFENIPSDLRDEMYAYLRANSAADRKPEMTDEQFYYKTRKNVVGPFKAQSWNLPADVKARVGKAWEDQFDRLFASLGLAGTRAYVEKFIHPVKIQPNLKDYLGEAAGEENVSDLAD